jgi:hypothetical protein
MARAATTRLKVNPVLGSPPTLEWRAIGELLIDEGYQRSLEAGASQSLIRRMAMYWDWGLCQPLAVSRRPDGTLVIVDGQHRASAAKLRSDIPHLPCVITNYASAGDEAAAFVALNQQRRPLLAAGDFESSQIVSALDDAGLRVASSTNLTALRPGAVSNIRGLQQCYRTHGFPVLTAALDVLAQSFKDQVLQYAGSIFPGIEAIVADEISRNANFSDGERFALMTEMVGGASQKEWYRDVSAGTAEHPTRRNAAAAVFRSAWAECLDAMLEEAA